MLEQSGLKNRQYLVTGSSSGVGRAVCIALANAGAHVVLSGRNRTRLEETLSNMPGCDHHIMPCDLAQPDGIEAWARSIIRQCPPLDGIAYCAGVGGRWPLRHTTTAMLHSVMQVNFYSFVECVRWFTQLKERKHPMRIVAMSSLASETNLKSYTPYAASKAALEAAVRVLGTELLPRNTGICTVKAAFIDTPMLDVTKEMQGDLNAHFKKIGYQPMGLIPPDAVAAMILFLLSDAARHITGTQIPFNAGAPS
ncbi:MAG: SDR family oxidoreductase [Desulfovibrionaceae bacterium]|nr:SDR family oxidoreductase [Desulfovibrionaceae bacterium]